MGPDRSYYQLNQSRALRKAYQGVFWSSLCQKAWQSKHKLCFLALTTGIWSPWWFTLYGWPLGTEFALKIKLLQQKGFRFLFCQEEQVSLFKTSGCLLDLLQNPQMLNPTGEDYWWHVPAWNHTEAEAAVREGKATPTSLTFIPEGNKHESSCEWMDKWQRIDYERGVWITKIKCVRLSTQ